MKRYPVLTKSQLIAAEGKTLPDIIGPGLVILFCGINPGLYSAAVGHHFSRPGNRFWKTLYESGITPRLLSPFEDRSLLQYGCGSTNLVGRATAAAAELSLQELAAGKETLVKKVRKYRPQTVAVLGIGAFRCAFAQPAAVLGPQRETIDGTRLWVLPNPSGLNASYQLKDLARLFKTLRDATEIS